MIYLISYDIKEYNKEDDQRVIAKLRAMGATRCLHSEWLIESAGPSLSLAQQVEEVLSDRDRLLVVDVGNGAYLNLLNSDRSVALLGKA